MSNKSEGEEEEIWKVYPKIPFIEASNLGKIRTKDRYVTCKNGVRRLVKGRVLKQYLLSCGYLYVMFKMNGKTISLSVHRVVAITFLPNPNNLPEVNHKDNNRTNNSVSNLEWCSRKYNEDYKKNFGTSQAEVFGRPVFAVNLETGKVLRFETQSEAARQLSIDVRDINNVIKGKQKTAHGYWFTEDESEITEEKIKEIKDNMHFFGGVIAVNLDTFEVFRFESQAEAARQLGTNAGDIWRVFKSKYTQTGGYWFTYADENAVEKAREKFGDEVARKVEELILQNQN